jgi:Glucodextranase, domain B
VVTDPMIPVSGSATPGAKVFVNNTSITVSTSGSFNYTVPIPNEVQNYTVHVVSRLGDNEMSEDRTVTYQPAQTPLMLTINSPVDGQVIKENVLQVVGKTSPQTSVTINGHPAIVSPQGNITYGAQLTEKDIGDYEIDIVATSSDNKEMTKTVRVTVDVTSPQINISVPTLVIQEQGLQATRTGKLTVNVLDRTPEDQISLEYQINGRTDNLTMNPGDRQYLNLDEGKNTYIVKAYDKARNISNVVQGSIYYLPGNLVIEIRDPVDNPMVISDLPPMPKNVAASQMRVEVEIEDGIGNIPESIKYCWLIGDGKTLQMTGNNNYRYYTNVSLSYGTHTYTVQVQDLCGNLMSKTLVIIAKQ